MANYVHIVSENRPKLHGSESIGADSVSFSVMPARWGGMRCLREVARQEFTPFMLW